MIVLKPVGDHLINSNEWIAAGHGRALGWRLAFYALLTAVGVKAASTRYVADVSGEAVIVVALLPGVIYLGIFLAWLARLWPDSPFDHIREGWPASIKALDRTCLFVGASLFAVWIAPIKGTFAPFWADTWLTGFDRAIFGTDPWRLTHATLGPATTLIDYLYGIWPITISAASLGVALFASERRLGRLFVGFAISWTLLGVVLASYLASAGPIFGPDLGFGFDALRDALNQSAPYSTFARQFLWQSYTSGSTHLGSGISAAPSMHCALTFVLCFSAWRTRWLLPAIAYAAFIWFGSVHLGWHYFVDGLISLAGVTILWPLVCLTVDNSLTFRLRGSKVASQQS